MLKEAIEKIKEMAIEGDKIQTIVIDRCVYAKDPKGYLVKISPEESRRVVPKEIAATSLEGFVNWIKREVYEGTLIVEVTSYNSVYCRTERDIIREGETHCLIRTIANNKTFFEGFRGHEEAMIELRSKFQHTEDIDYLLKLLSSITLEDKVQSDDNGLSQQVTVRKGVALKGTETVKPIVKLKPYRTFYEVEQPESEFLLRLGDDGKVGFFEADGGMWEMTARRTIKEYLEKALEKEIGENRVVVTL